MNDFSLGEKFGILWKIISSSPLFLSCFLIGIIFLVFFTINITKNKRVNKYAAIFFIVFILLVISIVYGNTIMKIFDNFFEEVFMALYFPNLAVYSVVIVTINICLVYALFNYQSAKLGRITSIICGFIMDILLIFIIGVVSSNNIDVYEKLTVYSNSNLLVLLELSMGIFASWALIMLLVSAKRKLNAVDKKENEE